jgi:hypothetical protein
MFPPPNAKFAAESFGSEASEGRIRSPFFSRFLLKNFSEKVLTKRKEKLLMFLFSTEKAL